MDRKGLPPFAPASECGGPGFVPETLGAHGFALTLVGTLVLWWRSPALLRIVIVNLRSDAASALRGVLMATRGRWLILKDVSLLKSGAAPTPVDGDVLIDRENVAFIQVP